MRLKLFVHYHGLCVKDTTNHHRRLFVDGEQIKSQKGIFVWSYCYYQSVHTRSQWRINFVKQRGLFLDVCDGKWIDYATIFTFFFSYLFLFILIIMNILDEENRALLENKEIKPKRPTKLYMIGTAVFLLTFISVTFSFFNKGKLVWRIHCWHVKKINRKHKQTAFDCW